MLGTMKEAVSIKMIKIISILNKSIPVIKTKLAEAQVLGRKVPSTLEVALTSHLGAKFNT